MSRFFFSLGRRRLARVLKCYLFYISYRIRVGVGVGVGVEIGVGVDQEPGVGAGVGTALLRLRTPGFKDIPMAG